MKTPAPATPAETAPVLVEPIREFLQNSGRKATAFEGLIRGLAPTYALAEVNEDGSRLILTSSTTLAKIILCAYAPSESPIIVDPNIRGQEWTACFGLEIPSYMLLNIVTHIQ